jgi:hypothetical protein
VALQYLVAGPEPGQKLFLLSMSLVALWSGLIIAAVTVIATQSFCAWRQGRIWHAKLEESQVRLRMNGGLMLKGGSAGLPFCLNTLLSLYRAEASSARHSWLWQRLFQKPGYDAKNWAATGVITADGYLKPVVLAQFWISIPTFILGEASLGLVGLGVAEPLPSWGSLLRELEGLTAISGKPWVFVPLLLLIASVTSFQVLLMDQEIPS